jgi:hypothetical protein
LRCHIRHLSDVRPRCFEHDELRPPRGEAAATWIPNDSGDYREGGAGDDQVQGDSGNDVPNGGDLFFGDDGDDLLDRGSATNSFDGSSGFDHCHGDPSNSFASCEKITSGGVG